LLSNPYVRDVIGQKETTVDFPAYAKWGFAVFLHLPTTIDLEARRFIGTIFLSELFHALYNRPEEAKQHTFGLYVDEFQQFATDQFADFILEGRKFGVATTIAHQERVGQFGENQKILGATMACANKVIFQVTPRDARELAPEFVEKPVALESRRILEMVICKDPLWHLLRRDHANPRIQELFRKFGQPAFDKLTSEKNQAEHTQLIRSGYFDDAMLYRDEASLSGVDERREGRSASLARGRDLTISHAALDRTETILQQAMNKHGLAKETLDELQLLLMNIHGTRRNIQVLEIELVALMEGRAVCQPGDETFARCIRLLVGSPWIDFIEPDPAYL
jgi:hypothetical protein